MRYFWLIAFATTICSATLFAACSASNDETSTQGSGGTSSGGGSQGGATGQGGGPSSSSTGIEFDGGGDACSTAVTCADKGANCGPIADGCGGILDCGMCPMGQSCGGGGTPSVCGSPPCTPKTCA